MAWAVCGVSASECAPAAATVGLVTEERFAMPPAWSGPLLGHQRTSSCWPGGTVAIRADVQLAGASSLSQRRPRRPLSNAPRSDIIFIHAEGNVPSPTDQVALAVRYAPERSACKPNSAPNSGKSARSPTAVVCHLGRLALPNRVQSSIIGVHSGPDSLIALVFRREPSKLPPLLVKAGEWGFETSTCWTRSSDF